MDVILFVGVESISRGCKEYLNYSAVAIESFGSFSALITDFNWNAYCIYNIYCEYCFYHSDCHIFK